MPGIPIPINNLMVGAFPNSVMLNPEAPQIPRPELLQVDGDCLAARTVQGPLMAELNGECLEAWHPGLSDCNENSLTDAALVDSLLVKEGAAALDNALTCASNPADSDTLESALSIMAEVAGDLLVPASSTRVMPKSVTLEESVVTASSALEDAIVRAKLQNENPPVQCVVLPPNLAALPWLNWFDNSGWNLELPFSRLSAAWIAWILCAVGLVKSISKRTVQRWLADDRIKPWRFRSWITPKDLPSFLIRAKEVLDLYTRVRMGQLDPDEDVWSGDEKTSIQARGRASHSPPKPGEVARMEPSYDRNGALQLLAALNVGIGYVIARLVDTKHFDVWSEFIAEVIMTSVAAGKRRIHIILDNGSTHRPKFLDEWLKGWLAASKLVGVQVTIHWLPVRSSWLNQVEIFFSVLQRQALTPNDFTSLDALKVRILKFVEMWNGFPKPINWTYTTEKMLKKFARPAPAAANASK